MTLFHFSNAWSRRSQGGLLKKWREYFIVWINDESVFKCVFVLSSGLWSGWRSRDEKQKQQRHREHTKQKRTTQMQCLRTGIYAPTNYVFTYKRFTIEYLILIGQLLHWAVKYLYVMTMIDGNAMVLLSCLPYYSAVFPVS